MKTLKDILKRLNPRKYKKKYVKKEDMYFDKT